MATFPAAGVREMLSAGAVEYLLRLRSAKKDCCQQARRSIRFWRVPNQ
jgi:hypothetical protein